MWLANLHAPDLLFDVSADVIDLARQAPFYAKNLQACRSVLFGRSISNKCLSYFHMAGQQKAQLPVVDAKPLAIVLIAQIVAALQSGLQMPTVST